MKKPDKGAAPFMGSVKVGPKGQIVIPKEVRDMFGVEPGDTMIILAHPKRGIALERPTVLTRLADAVFEGRAAEVLSPEEAEGAEEFAAQVKKTVEGEDSERH